MGMSPDILPGFLRNSCHPGRSLPSATIDGSGIHSFHKLFAHSNTFQRDVYRQLPSNLMNMNYYDYAPVAAQTTKGVCGHPLGTRPPGQAPGPLALGHALPRAAANSRIRPKTLRPVPPMATTGHDKDGGINLELQSANSYVVPAKKVIQPFKNTSSFSAAFDFSTPAIPLALSLSKGLERNLDPVISSRNKHSSCTGSFCHRACNCSSKITKMMSIDESEIFKVFLEKGWIPGPPFDLSSSSRLRINYPCRITPGSIPSFSS